MEQLRPSEPAQTANNVIPQNSISSGQDITELVMDQKPENPDTKTREFAVSDMKEEPSKIKIDFFGGSNPNDFIKQPTEQAKTMPSQNGGGATQYINPVIGPSNSMGVRIDPAKIKEELKSNVKVLIAFIDFCLSWAGQALSKEGTQSQYTADKMQKDLLESAIVEFAYEKQIKMSAGWGLLFAFIAAYGFMLFAAAKKAYERWQRKKDGLKTIPAKNIPPATKKEEKPIAHWSAGVTEEDMKKYQEIKPIVKAPVVKPILETVYVENKIDGTLTPQQVPINKNQFPKWFNPDPAIIAKTREDLKKYIAREVYPMYLKNVSNNGVRKINYDPNTGEPKFIGKPTRVNKKV